MDGAVATAVEKVGAQILLSGTVPQQSKLPHQ